MTEYGGLVAFVIFLVVLIVLAVVFLLYMNSWLCFDKAPRFWCFVENYEKLSSIAATEEEEKKDWRDLEESEPEEMKVELDAVTIMEEKTGRMGEDSKRDDDNRSDCSDERIRTLGVVITKFRYEMMKNTLIIDLINIKNLPKKTDGGPSTYQLYVKIFDVNGRSLFKWHSSMFVEAHFEPKQSVEYTDMSAKDISSTAVRMRLYGCERKRRDKLLSESTIGLVSVNLRKEQEYKIKLERRAEIKLTSNIETELSEDYVSEASKKVTIKVEEQTGNQPELLLGLGYNHVTGRMTVEIVKGNAFKNPLVRGEEKLPNAFVKITICPKNTQVISKSKTTVRYNQANPLFKEKFMFQVSQHPLDEISVVISVYHKKSSHRKEIIGWFSIGHLNTSSEESSHWRSMLDSKGDISTQWHLLQPNTLSRHGLPGAD